MRAKLAMAALLGAAAAGCSLALDFDALGAGTPEDSGPPPCTDAASCDDGIDCTADACGEDGTCSHLPDNDLCDYLELCDLEDGCVPTGDECMVPADCDDGLTCTADDCVLGQCENEPDHAACESDNVCIENEACSPEECAGNEDCAPGTGCLPGNEFFCAQSGAPCMETRCDPAITAAPTCADFVVDGADDDEDTYLDAECGGDDCDDEDELIRPGVAEDCDGVDQDCDGLVDATALVGPLELDAAETIASPSVAAGGEQRAVVWQRGAAEIGAVLAIAIGADGAPIAAAADFTAAAGAGATGSAPDVAAGAPGTFWIAWVADAEDAAPAVNVVDLAVDAELGTAEIGAPLAVGDPGATAAAAPRIAFDGDALGSGWVTAFLASYGDGTEAVELAAQEMHSSPAGAAFAVSADTGAADGVAVAVAGANLYAVSFAREDAASDGDLEVFTSLVELGGGDAWANAAGYPIVVSPADDASAFADPSFAPAVAVSGTGPITAFVDTAAVSSAPPSDIYGWYGDALFVLIDEGTSYYREPAIAYDAGADRFAFLYLLRNGTYESLELLSLDAANLAPPPAPYAATSLASSSGTDDTGDARIAAVAEGRFAVVWVGRADGEDHLEYLDLAVCAAAD